MIDLAGRILRLIVSRVRQTYAALHGAIDNLSYPYVHLAKVEGAFPVALKLRTLYVLTEDGTPWQAAMVCPCGCGQTLDLNLLPDERPCWRYAADKKGRATLDPSVWRKIGCRSHFWLRRGRVVWV